METPYLELEDLRNNKLGKTRMYSYEEVKKIIKEWDEQAKSQLSVLQEEYEKVISRLKKRIKELKQSKEVL